MTTQKKLVRKENKKMTSKIIDVDCEMRSSEKAVFIEYEGNTWVASKDRLEQILNDTLVVQEGKRKGLKAKSLVFGLLTDETIDNDTQAFLTKKGKCMYFTTSLDPKEILVTSITSVNNLLYEDWDKIKLGKFQKIE